MAWEKNATNEVTIEGILNEVNLREDTDKNGKPVIFGSFTLKTTNTINGAEIVTEIPVRVYQKKMTNAGKPNPAYENAERIMKTFVSVAAGGEENADYLKIDGSGNIYENCFISTNSGQVISSPAVRASFVNKIKPSEYNPGAKFKNIIVIGKKIPEVDKEGVETGALIIKGILPQWGGRADAVDFVVRNKNAINHIEKNWNEGDTVLVAGCINFTSEVSEVEEGGSFGEPIVTRRTRTVRELVITGGHDYPLTEEEGAYNLDDIGVAINERTARIEEMKANRAAKTTTAPKAKNSFNF